MNCVMCYVCLDYICYALCAMCYVLCVFVALRCVLCCVLLCRVLGYFGRPFIGIGFGSLASEMDACMHIYGNRIG